MLFSVLCWTGRPAHLKFYLWQCLNILAPFNQVLLKFHVCHNGPLNNQLLNSSNTQILHPPCMSANMLMVFMTKRLNFWSRTLPVVCLTMLEVQALRFVEMLSRRASSLQCFQTVAWYESGLEQVDSETWIPQSSKLCSSKDCSWVPHPPYFVHGPNDGQISNCFRYLNLMTF